MSGILLVALSLLLLASNLSAFCIFNFCFFEPDGLFVIREDTSAIPSSEEGLWATATLSTFKCLFEDGRHFVNWGVRLDASDRAGKFDCDVTLGGRTTKFTGLQPGSGFNGIKEVGPGKVSFSAVCTYTSSKGEKKTVAIPETSITCAEEEKKNYSCNTGGNAGFRQGVDACVSDTCENGYACNISTCKCYPTFRTFSCGMAAPTGFDFFKDRCDGTTCPANYECKKDDCRCIPSKPKINATLGCNANYQSTLLDGQISITPANEDYTCDVIWNPEGQTQKIDYPKGSSSVKIGPFNSFNSPDHSATIVCAPKSDPNNPDKKINVIATTSCKPDILVNATNCSADKFAEFSAKLENMPADWDKFLCSFYVDNAVFSSYIMTKGEINAQIGPVGSKTFTCGFHNVTVKCRNDADQSQEITSNTAKFICTRCCSDAMTEAASLTCTDNCKAKLGEMFTCQQNCACESPKITINTTNGPYICSYRFNAGPLPKEWKQVICKHYSIYPGYPPYEYKSDTKTPDSTGYVTGYFDVWGAYQGMPVWNVNTFLINCSNAANSSQYVVSNVTNVSCVTANCTQGRKNDQEQCRDNCWELGEGYYCDGTACKCYYNATKNTTLIEIHGPDKISIPLRSTSTISAIITNKGTASLENLPVTITIGSTTSTKTVSIPAGGSATVTENVGCGSLAMDTPATISTAYGKKEFTIACQASLTNP